MAALKSDQGIDPLETDLEKMVEKTANVLGPTFRVGASGASSFFGASIFGVILSREECAGRDFTF